MGVQWFGQRQLQWRGLCKNISKCLSEQEKVKIICASFFWAVKPSTCTLSARFCAHCFAPQGRRRHAPAQIPDCFAPQGRPHANFAPLLFMKCRVSCSKLMKRCGRVVSCMQLCKKNLPEVVCTKRRALPDCQRGAILNKFTVKQHENKGKNEGKNASLPGHRKSYRQARQNREACRRGGMLRVVAGTEQPDALPWCVIAAVTPPGDRMAVGNPIPASCPILSAPIVRRPPCLRDRAVAGAVADRAVLPRLAMANTRACVSRTASGRVTQNRLLSGTALIPRMQTSWARQQAWLRGMTSTLRTVTSHRRALTPLR